MTQAAAAQWALDAALAKNKRIHEKNLALQEEHSKKLKAAQTSSSSLMDISSSTSAASSDRYRAHHLAAPVLGDFFLHYLPDVSSLLQLQASSDDTLNPMAQTLKDML